MRELLSKILLLNALVLGFICNIEAQLVTIETLLDTNTVELGRNAELKYKIVKRDNDFISLPTFTDTLFDGIELVAPVKIDSSFDKSSEKETLEQVLRITSYETGMRYIPAQNFILRTDFGTDTLVSMSSYLNIVGVAIDTTNAIRDISDVEWVLPTLRDFIPLVLVLLILGIIAFLIYYFWPGRHNKRIEQQIVKKADPPHIVALRELDKLKAQKLWQQNQLKEYYSRLTSIIRTYIEKQFGFPAMEQTTREILASVRDRELTEVLEIKQLEKLLNLADLVKFAKGQTLPEENIEHLESTYEFVKESHKKVVRENLKHVSEAIDNKLANSYALAKKIRNVSNLNDLEIINRLDSGYKLIQFNYTVSVIVMTFKLNSPIYLLAPDDNARKKGLLFTAISVVAGWWGIPWGPVRTLQSIRTNLKGGKKVEIQ